MEVLRSFGMKPMEGVRLTLITKDAHTAYRWHLTPFLHCQTSACRSSAPSAVYLLTSHPTRSLLFFARRPIKGCC